MKADLRFKLLQHLNQKKKDEGFTLIELLVVIIIIGILAAIALPSFLNQANKAKQSEGRQTVSALNKGQQAYFLEANEFLQIPEGDSQAAAKLGIGVRMATNNYTYSSTSAADRVDNYAKGKAAGPLKNVVGTVGLVTNPATGDKGSVTGLCETQKAGEAPGTPSINAAKGAIECTGNLQEVK